MKVSRVRIPLMIIGRLERLCDLILSMTMGRSAFYYFYVDDAIHTGCGSVEDLMRACLAVLT